MKTNTSPRVLIVDDDPGFRKVYKDVVEAAGFSTFEAGNGNMGFKMCLEYLPDLVLLDLVMPQMNGFELLKFLKAEKSTCDIPVVILSVMGEKKKIEEAMKLGASSFLTKGYDRPKDVVARLNQALGLVPANIRFKINVQPSDPEVLRLGSELHMGKSFMCESCHSLYQIELDVKTANHFLDPFSARLVCQCRR